VPSARLRMPAGRRRCGASWAFASRANGHRLRAGRERGVRRTDGGREHRHLVTWICLDPRPAQQRFAESLPCVPHAPALPRARGAGTVRRRAQDGLDCPRSRVGPKLLLLDEPTEGLSPAIIPSIIEGLAHVRSCHAVFIAESNIHHVPDFTDRLYVIEYFCGQAGGGPSSGGAALLAGLATLIDGGTTPLPLNSRCARRPAAGTRP
jgi:hypothetical protein